MRDGIQSLRLRCNRGENDSGFNTMDPGYLDKLQDGGDHLLYADWERDGAEIQHAEFKRCRFVGVGLKKAKFTDCTFSACRFEDVYLPYGSFDRVDLTATRFSNCNLRHTTFEGCKLWYTEFDRCELDHESILATAPAEQNLRMRLIRNLRLNAESVGDGKTADALYIREMDALCAEQWCIFTHCNAYYKDRYFGAARFKGLVEWSGLVISKHVWGYGVRLSALFRSAAAIILISGIVIWLSGSRVIHPPTGSAIAPAGFSEALYLCVVSFTTLGYGDFAPWDSLARFVCVVDAAAGAVFLGLLAASAFRKIKR
jgi:hypothetical protein